MYVVDVPRNAFQTISLQDITRRLYFLSSCDNDMFTFICLNFHGGTWLNTGSTTTSTDYSKKGFTFSVNGQLLSPNLLNCVREPNSGPLTSLCVHDCQLLSLSARILSPAALSSAVLVYCLFQSVSNAAMGGRGGGDHSSERNT